MKHYTNDELLKLAAEAVICMEIKEVSGHWCVPARGGNPNKRRDGDWEIWNPLEDDGDAFRLANNLNINIKFGSCEDDAPIVTCSSDLCEESFTVGHFPDPCKEARKLIVLMAAQISIERAKWENM